MPDDKLGTPQIEAESPICRADRQRNDETLTDQFFVKKNKCANCSKQATAAFVPFCSKRCADVDLGRWLNGSYAVPVVEEELGDFQGDSLPTDTL